MAQKSIKIDFYSTTGSKELGEILIEIGLLTLIFMQCGVSMSDMPSSAVSQVISRCLNYYGFCKNYTTFIDSYDKLSMHDSSLIVPYQLCESPGGNVLFQLDKHSKPIMACVTSEGLNEGFLFSLSDKLSAYNMIIFCDMGEIPMPYYEETRPYTFLICYLVTLVNGLKNVPLKNLHGGFLVGNSAHLLSYSFDGMLLFHKTFPVDAKLLGMFMISSNHVVVLSENSKRLSVFNVNTGEDIVKRELTFDQGIKNVFCNLRAEMVLHFGDFEKYDFFCILYHGTTNSGFLNVTCQWCLNLQH